MSIGQRAPTLDGRTAIVTGAGNGLGRAEAVALARAGARLVLNDLPGPAVQDTADEITAAGGQAVVCEGDIGEWSTGERLLAAALDSFGGLDILVNNAGVLRDRMIFTMSAEEWDLVLRVHLRGHFVTTRLATAYWREASKQAGGPVYARIVNTSSEAFLLGSAGQPNYAAAKAGIAALTVVTARSCARYGVRANAICPRARTDMTADLMGAPPGAGRGPARPRARGAAGGLPGRPGRGGDQRRGIRGARRGGGGDGAAADPGAFPGRRARLGRRHVDARRRGQALGPMSASRARRRSGFACEDTLPLAAETIGFPSAPGSDHPEARARGHEATRPGRHDRRTRPRRSWRASRKLQLATINQDGTPHLVTMYYVLTGGQITFWTYRASQKARNLARDPRVTCLVETGEEYFALRGVQVRGRARCVDDPAGVREIGRASRRDGRRHRTGAALDDYVEHAARKRIGFIVEPHRVSSWDHAKLLPSGADQGYGASRYSSSSRRPMIIFWISAVPSPISSIGASRYSRSISYSLEKP